MTLDTLLSVALDVAFFAVLALSLVETPTTYGFRSTVKGYTWSTYNQLRFDDLS